MHLCVQFETMESSVQIVPFVFQIHLSYQYINGTALAENATEQPKGYLTFRGWEGRGICFADIDR